MFSVLNLPSTPVTPSAGCSAPHRREWRRRMGGLRPHGKKPASPGGDGGSQSENAVLKLAWYGSELLGIAASFFRPSRGSLAEQERELIAEERPGPVLRAQVVEAIKDDFQRSYFVTGNLTMYAYEDNCEFADPAGSFRGLNRFKRNCSNFGSLLVKSNMKLTKWEEFELRGTRNTISTLIQERHVEHWNVPKMALLKQIFRPTRWVWDTSRSS